MPESGYSEADTRAKLIDPAIHRRGWLEDMICREETAGNIAIIDGKARRGARGQVDYTLRLKLAAKAQPVAIAVLEAKRESLPPNHGLDQAKTYAMSLRLNVPFVFSSNGHQFVEFDRFTGLTSAPQPMGDFPQPQSLRERYERHHGFSLEDAAAKPLLTPYHNGEGGRRYYQDAAIRAVMEKIARAASKGEAPRALLSLATGAGKTFIAVNLLKRIADAGQLRRALFLCDRDELRAQALTAFQNVFGSDAAEVKRSGDGGNHARNARVHIATYQTLGVDEGAASFLAEHYPQGHFSHIVIDECHRSAWGKWSEALAKNPKAVHIGLTATPRTLKAGKRSKEAKEDAQINADNQKYFGKPVYEYDMAQAMEDGYLAVCEINKGAVDLDDTGITMDDIMQRRPRDATTGKPVTREALQELYEKTDFEARVLLPDRVQAMCEDLFRQLLLADGPEQKTIIFCARDRHADDVAAAMNNLYANWCAAQQGRERLEPYAFKCTAAASGNDQLPDFRAAARHHFIATTVELLTTGVDVPSVRNIAFFKYVKSPISFYQMIGRGTRLDPGSDKLMFRVYDYTGATDLFGEEFVTPPPRPGGTGEPPPPEPETAIIVDGFEVKVDHPAGPYVVVQEGGQAMPIPVDEYKQRLSAQLLAQAPTLEDFRQRWIQPDKRRALLDRLVQSGHPPRVLQTVQAMADYDLYDVLADLGFRLKPRTRTQRTDAFTYKHEDWLDALPERAAAAIRALAGQFAAGGTDSLESQMIFQTPEVQAAGGLAALQAAGKPAQLLTETKSRIFSA